MGKRNFDHIDKNFESFKKIKPYITLSDEDFKNLQEDAHKFALANQERCKPTPRIWNREIWKTITLEFVDDGSLGERYWSKNRPEYGQGEGLGWPNDKHDVLKCELKRITANKRKAAVEDGDVTVTPRKKAKKDEAVKDAAEVPRVPAAGTADNSIKQMTPPAPAEDGIAVVISSPSKASNQTEVKVATSIEDPKPKGDKSLTTSNAFQPAKSPIKKSNQSHTAPISRRRKEQNVKDKTAQLMKRNEEAKRKAAEEVEDSDDEITLDAEEKKDDDVQIIDSSNIAFDLTSAFKPSVNKVSEAGDAAPTVAVHGNGTAINEPTGAPLIKDSGTPGTAKNAATPTIPQEEHKSIFGPHTPPPKTPEEVEQHASSKVSGTKEGTLTRPLVHPFRGDASHASPLDDHAVPEVPRSKGVEHASALTSTVDHRSGAIPYSTPDPDTLALAYVQRPKTSNGSNPSSNNMTPTKVSVTHKDRDEGARSSNQIQGSTVIPKSSANPASHEVPESQRNPDHPYPEGSLRYGPDVIPFTIMLKNHEHAFKHLDHPRDGTILDLFEYALVVTANEVLRAAVGKMQDMVPGRDPPMKATTFVPGGTLIDFSYPSAEFPRRWKGAMRLAFAAVGRKGLFEGQRVRFLMELPEAPVA